jgi:adenylylsulfate kinase
MFPQNSAPMLSDAARQASRTGLTIWFTGLSAAGKTTLNDAVRERLQAVGYAVEPLDGDVLRQNLWKDLGFSKQDRDENVRRIGFVAHLLSRNGIIVLVSAISPYRAARDEVRCRIGNFVEVYVNAPVDVCEQRDRKGLYRKARAGQLSGFTGVDDPYEPPLCPEIECHTDRETVAESADKIMRYLEARLSSAAASGCGE